MISVLICDDQEIVRKGLNIILSHAEGFEVVGLAENGQEACEKTIDLKPDVVLMDLKMPLKNGIQATKEITGKNPNQSILVLTTYDGDDWVFDAIQAGARGYLLKDSDGEDILQAIRETAAGRVHLDSRIAGKVLDEFRRMQTAEQPPITKERENLHFETLTAREQSILEQMALGKSNNEIAGELFLAEGTVKNNVSQIIQKLHADSRTQAIINAYKGGLVDF